MWRLPTRSNLWEDEAAADAEPVDKPGESEVWYEEALEPLNENPGDEVCLANFQEARKAAARMLGGLYQNRVNRGFYPNGQKGKGKSGGKTKTDGTKTEFKGKRAPRQGCGSRLCVFLRDRDTILAANAPAKETRTVELWSPSLGRGLCRAIGRTLDSTRRARSPLTAASTRPTMSRAEPSAWQG